MMDVLLDRILVRRQGVPEARTAGGIYMPASSKEGGRDTQQGIVLRTGPGVPLDNGGHREMRVKPGDTVWFGYHVGWFVRAAGDDELMVISERDVVAIKGA